MKNNITTINNFQFAYLNKRKNKLRFNVVLEVNSRTFYLFNITMLELDKIKIEYAFKNNKTEIFNYYDIIDKIELYKCCNTFYIKYYKDVV